MLNMLAMKLRPATLLCESLLLLLAVSTWQKVYYLSRDRARHSRLIHRGRIARAEVLEALVILNSVVQVTGFGRYLGRM